ncbi:MAG: hypothetical protein L6Q99_21205 [Planctomycetes bacterium]|nr:hypothetical protein [Planctomycetota bacterium]
MRSGKDPSSMTPRERADELASILATAYRRLVLNREKQLAESAEREAQCVDAVNSEDRAEEMR